MNKILIVFGTRPELIKLYPVIRAFNKEEFELVVCSTGQHREMIDQLINLFQIKIDYDLNIMTKNQSLNGITQKIVSGMDEIYTKEKPELVLVHGDTTTAMAAALAAFNRGIKIGHIEAGLRTYDNQSPFPEEANRRLIGTIADYHFAPTDINYQQLKEERLPGDAIVTGNTAIDMMKYTVTDDFNHEVMDWLGDSKLILVTIHRRESLGDGMREIFQAINDFSLKHENYKVVYPIHLNPKVREIASDVFDSSNIKLIEPLNVIDFHNLIARSAIILTDSGGIQEEAPYFNVPVLVARNTTERQEGISAKTSLLVGTTYQSIYDALVHVGTNSSVYDEFKERINPYGDGLASERIVEYIKTRL